MKHKIYGLAVIGDQNVSGNQTTDGDHTVGGRQTIGGDQDVGGRIINHQIPTRRVSITNDYSAVPGDYIHFDTYSNEITVTLPTNPADGDAIGFVDVRGWVGTKLMYIDPVGRNVMGDTDILGMDMKHASFILEYDEEHNDWRVK